MPIIIQSAFNLAIQASVFVRLFFQTMNSDYDDAERSKLALLSMVGLGLGEIIGSLLFGKLQDTARISTTIAVNMLSSIVAFTIVLSYISTYEYSFGYSFSMTFFWGVYE